MSFPKNFRWGVSTAAFQIEGAWLKDGKGPSIWDAFTQIPGKILNNDNAETACDHYHLFEKDVMILKELGVNSYRFSLSWPRILPKGNGTVNRKGIEFYSRLIDLLTQHNIEPWVTLHHWDLPLALQFEHDGWLNSDLPSYFEEYASVCFQEFGDRVRNWITINEPWVISILGYGKGEFAPGRISVEEPYIVAHNLLRAHAKAANLYKNDYQKAQKGKIGLTNNCDWREPRTESIKDRNAALRSLEFALAWFADPVHRGDYPDSMKSTLGKRLPEFTSAESDLLVRSSDFFGLNHYSTYYVEDMENEGSDISSNFNSGISKDENVFYTSDDNWKKTAYDWNIVPWGFSKMLEWIDQRYDHPEIFVTENGATFNDLISDGKINDENRIDYLKSYINAMKNSIDKGVKVNGYFIWSLLDNFEWAQGFSKRFGLYYTDYQTLERIPKSSALWFKEFLKNQ
jgi:beta-glucosidase